MKFGVPLQALIVVVLLVTLLATFLGPLLFLGLPLLVFVMRLITKSDDQMFRLLWLKFYFRVIRYNANGRFWRCSYYSPLSCFRRKKNAR
jgi:type IV secretion system protein VirB3